MGRNAAGRNCQGELKEETSICRKRTGKCSLARKSQPTGCEKPAHGQEEYKTSALYAKVSRITKELQKVETKENLNEEEWSQFIALTNAGWYGIITYLDERYNLSAEEIRICCLYLAQVPVIHMGHFLHIQSRSTIQARTKNILLKMGAPQGLSLKNVLFSLAEQLKSSN